MSPYRVKVVRADKHAREKGFRAGQVYWVTDEDPTCNPKRGTAYLLYNWRTRKFECFFMDQLRRKPLHSRAWEVK